MAYTNIDDPSAHFQTATYTGNLVNGHSITNDGNSDLQPDLTWIKARNSSTYNHIWVDSSRGNNLVINSNNTNAEANIGVSVVTPSTDGFSLADWSHINYTGVTYAAWQWKANGGTTSSNTSGTITSTVQANTDAGFSIVTFTSPLSGSFSVGHGLGVKPDMVITKRLNDTSGWWTWHKGLTNDTTYYLDLSSTSAEASASNMWGTAGFTSSVFGMNYPTSAYANSTYVAYCFAEKQGYSKFGKYVGNGNANGTFVYTGFKPAFLIVKRIDAGDNWVIIDSKRDTYNVQGEILYANLANAEGTFASVDSLSNGFKLRQFGPAMNTSGGTYIYMAFAENPFVTSTGIPTTAR